MRLIRKVLPALGALALIGGIGITGATAVSASSPGCAFTNGCATLHGTDAGGHQVAMDAKKQSAKPGTLVIGYPDIAGDGATNFDAVLHFTTQRGQTVWSDSGLTLWGSWNPMSTPGVLPFPASETAPVVLGGVTYNATAGCLDFTVSGGQPFTPASVPGYKATLTGLTGAAVTISPYSGSHSTGTICIGGDGLTPGVYHNLVLTVSDSNASPAGTSPVTPAGPETASVTFAAQLYGYQVTNPDTTEPFYTFVYAKGGVWSSECVTDVNGSGALQLQSCTLGKNRYQDFFALNGSGAPVQVDSTGVTAYHFQDWLASIANASSSCLTDPSSLNPAAPQADAADEASSPAGRQLRTDGSCTAAGNLFSWNT